MKNVFKVTVTIEKSLGDPEDYVVYCKSLEIAIKSVQDFYDTTNKNYCKQDFTGFSASIERIDVITQ